MPKEQIPQSKKISSLESTKTAKTNAVDYLGRVKSYEVAIANIKPKLDPMEASLNDTALMVAQRLSVLEELKTKVKDSLEKVLADSKARYNIELIEKLKQQQVEIENYIAELTKQSAELVNDDLEVSKLLVQPIQKLELDKNSDFRKEQRLTEVLINYRQFLQDLRTSLENEDFDVARKLLNDPENYLDIFDILNKGLLNEELFSEWANGDYVFCYSLVENYQGLFIPKDLWKKVDEVIIKAPHSIDDRDIFHHKALEIKEWFEDLIKDKCRCLKGSVTKSILRECEVVEINQKERMIKVKIKFGNIYNREELEEILNGLFGNKIKIKVKRSIVNGSKKILRYFSYYD